jgi:hypothetical protein
MVASLALMASLAIGDSRFGEAAEALIPDRASKHSAVSMGIKIA